MTLTRANLARGTLWNVLGQGAPLVVAIFAIPQLVHALGAEKFGVLVLVWMFIGYFSLFDLGIGRALTQLVSERLDSPEQPNIASLFWTAMLLMLMLGLAGAAILLLAAPAVVNSLLRIPEDFRDEAFRSLQVLALAIPSVVLTAGFAGFLAARQRFDVINMLRLPMGLYTYVAPWLVVLSTPDLLVVSLALAFGRVLFLALHLVACLQIDPALRQLQLDSKSIAPLLRFGSWMTVSNIVGPVMVYMDRFVIGAMLSMSAVAYYATPYEVVTRLWIIPVALVAVLFPAFASLHGHDRNQLVRLFERGLRYMTILMFPLALVIVAFAKQGLHAWLGAEFADRSTTVLRWLAIGVFLNSLCQIAFALIQAVGRPDLSAKFHVLQLPLYLALLWFLLRDYGIEGAAIAWTLRILLDGVMLALAVATVVPECRKVVRAFTPYALAGVFVLSLFVFMNSLTVTVVSFCIFIAAFTLFCWHSLIEDDEKTAFMRRLQAVFSQR